MDYDYVILEASSPVPKREQLEGEKYELPETRALFLWTCLGESVCVKNMDGKKKGGKGKQSTSTASPDIPLALDYGGKKLQTDKPKTVTSTLRTLLSQTILSHFSLMMQLLHRHWERREYIRVIFPILMLLKWCGAEPNDPRTDRSKDGETFCSTINCHNGRYMLSCKIKVFHSFTKDGKKVSTYSH